MIKKIGIFTKNYVWGIFAEPTPMFRNILRVLPFILFIFGYVLFSAHQTAEDPKQKIYPSISKMATRFYEYSFEPDRQIVANRINQNKKEINLKNEEINEKNILISKNNIENNESNPLIPKIVYKKVNPYKDWKKIQKDIKKINKKLKILENKSIFSSEEKRTLLLDKISLKSKGMFIGLKSSPVFNDTFSSLYRIGIAMTIASSIALAFAIYMGTYKLVEYSSRDFITMFSLIQPVAIMPVIMIIFGVEDYGKIIYIILGVLPSMLLTLFMKVKEIPIQTIVKSKTLGANDFQTISKVVFPQILPHFIDAVRLTLFLAWILLLTSEIVPTETGLGFRIHLEKRFANMDVIIPYVIWIALISYSLDRILAFTQKTLSPWHKSR